jgi:hypothetical protein
MSEPTEPNIAAELETLRRTLAEVNQKNATRMARIQELEQSVGAITTRATEAESRIKALTIDGPINDLCKSISKAPKALRSAIDNDYRVELKDGVLTLLNASDGQQVMHEGKPVPVQADAIRNLLLGTKDEDKAKLYNAILIANKASGADGAHAQRTVAPVSKHQFGLR